MQRRRIHTRRILESSDAALAKRITCELCGHQATGRWQLAHVQLRDDLALRLHPQCRRVLEVALAERGAQDQTLDGRPLAEAAHAAAARYFDGGPRSGTAECCGPGVG